MDLYMEFDRPLGERELDALRALVKKRSPGRAAPAPARHGGILQARVPQRLARAHPAARNRTPRRTASSSCDLPADARCVDVGTGSGRHRADPRRRTPRGARAGRGPFAQRPDPRAGKRREARAGRRAWNSSRATCSRRAPGRSTSWPPTCPTSPRATSPGSSREVQHDPMMALDGGPDGLDLVTRCVAQAHERSRPAAGSRWKSATTRPRACCELLARGGFRRSRP